MAVATDFTDLKSSLAVTAYDFDPGATTATSIAWVDMNGYSSIMVGFFRTVGTSATTLSITSDSDSDGGGTNVTVKTKVLTAAEPNAVGDYTWIEVSESDIAEADADGRYVTATVSSATSTDEGVVIYIRKAKHLKLNATADNIA